MASVEGVVYSPIQNVPLFIQENAIEWHNNVTGDEWELDMVTHPDIQHRIGLLVDMCDEYIIENGKVKYIEQDEY